MGGILEGGRGKQDKMRNRQKGADQSEIEERRGEEWRSDLARVDWGAGDGASHQKLLTR